MKIQCDDEIEKTQKQADCDGPTLQEGKCLQKTEEDNIDVTKIGRLKLI